MANDTTKTVDVKDAAEKAPDKQTSGQVDPMLEKTTAPDLTAKETPPPTSTDKTDPGKVVAFDKAAKPDKSQDDGKKKPPAR